VTVENLEGFDDVIIHEAVDYLLCVNTLGNWYLSNWSLNALITEPALEIGTNVTTHSQVSHLKARSTTWL